MTPPAARESMASEKRSDVMCHAHHQYRLIAADEQITAMIAAGLRRGEKRKNQRIPFRPVGRFSSWDWDLAFFPPLCAERGKPREAKGCGGPREAQSRCRRLPRSERLRPLRACPVHTCVSPRTQVLIRVKAQSWTQPASGLVLPAWLVHSAYYPYPYRTSYYGSMPRRHVNWLTATPC